MLTTPDYLSLLTPEQRASLPVEWFGPACEECREMNITCLHGGCYYIGPDILNPANLVALLVFCDAVNESPVSLWWNDVEFYMFIKRKQGHGPTRHAAALAALDKVLGVEA